MNHYEIRNRILLTLYFKHYTGQAGVFVNTDEIIKDAILEFTPKDSISGDLDYLHERGLINVRKVIGPPYPVGIKITFAGIEEAEKILSNLTQYFERGDFKHLRRSQDYLNLSSELGRAINDKIKFKIISAILNDFELFEDITKSAMNRQKT